MSEQALAVSNPITQDGHDGGSSRNVNAFSSEAAFVVGQRMAIALGKSTLVPEAYHNNIPNCMIAMELANRIGASVFAVMQNIDIIHGRPAWRATFLIATVNACGKFSRLKPRFEGTPGTKDFGCRMVAKDLSDGEECIGALITLAMADAEGWSKKNGSKWRTMPEQMLMYRAAAFWTRVFAPELSLGMHTAEEIEDIGATAITQAEGPAKVSPLTDVLAKAIRGRIGPQEPEQEPEQTSEHEQEPEREPGSDDQD